VLAEQAAGGPFSRVLDPETRIRAQEVPIACTFKSEGTPFSLLCYLANVSGVTQVKPKSSTCSWNGAMIERTVSMTCPCLTAPWRALSADAHRRPTAASVSRTSHTYCL